MIKMTTDVMKEKTTGIDGQKEANRSLDKHGNINYRILCYLKMSDLTKIFIASAI